MITAVRGTVTYLSYLEVNRLDGSVASLLFKKLRYLGMNGSVGVVARATGPPDLRET